MSASVSRLPVGQLSFDVWEDGAKPETPPEVSTFTVSGELAMSALERYAEDELVVQIVDPDGGIVVAKAAAFVSQIGFVTHRKKGERPWVERRHKVKIGALETDNLE